MSAAEEGAEEWIAPGARERATNERRRNAQLVIGEEDLNETMKEILHPVDLQ